MKKLSPIVLLLGALALALVPFAGGTPEYAKKEKRKCTYCHTAVGKPDLNEAGKYYKDNNYSMEGFEKKKP